MSAFIQFVVIVFINTAKLFWKISPRLRHIVCIAGRTLNEFAFVDHDPEVDEFNFGIFHVVNNIREFNVMMYNIIIPEKCDTFEELQDGGQEYIYIVCI